MPKKYGQKWSEEETILAFYYYSHIPFGKITKTNPEVVRLANIIGRTPSSVVLKMANLAHFDPEVRNRNLIGMPHGSKLDEKIVKRFINDWEELALIAKQFEARSLGQDIEDIIPMTISLPEGDPASQSIHNRVNQQFFTEAVLSAYQQQCCITGIAVPFLLVAGHIKPWAASNPKTERSNPCNGLCLNGLHYQAFKNGLITVLPNLTIRISGSLLQYKHIDDTGIQWLLQCDGQKIREPERFFPSKEFLQYHNNIVFIS